MNWMYNSGSVQCGPARDSGLQLIHPPRSRLLASDAVTLDHRQVAQRVREILERYHEFHANRNNAPLGEEQRQTLMRGERIDLFFSQPFVVAEAFTDIPGMYLTREETISSFRDLLDGRYDASPTHVFKFVGMIEPN